MRLKNGLFEINKSNNYNSNSRPGAAASCAPKQHNKICVCRDK